MTPEQRIKYTELYQRSLQPPYFGGFRRWAEENISLPAAYAIPGDLDLSTSPYLLKPAEAIDNPQIYHVNLCAATQIGKSLLSELYIPYIIINNPGPLFRIFQSKDVSDIFAEQRLIPLLRNCAPVKPLLDERFATKKSGVVMPHMAITFGSSGTSLQHGMSVKYLLCDEVHQYEAGQFNKFLARTTAFAGRRKIICASQPNRTGSEWEQICNKGKVYEWHWRCPCCGKLQPFIWSDKKANGRYAGFNWETILGTDGETDVAASCRTTVMECAHCDHQVRDNPIERRQLNDTADYVLISDGGEPGVVTYTCPNFVNINLTFASAAAQYMQAKRFKRLTGIDEQMEIFVTQVLGKFYKAEPLVDVCQIITETYDKENLDNQWLPVMGVDVQRKGNVKYWVVRAFHKNGNESRRLGFGVCQTFDEIDKIAKQYKVTYPLVHVDSGDGSRTLEVYQECVTHGQSVPIAGRNTWVCWTPLKGDGSKVSYKHPIDGTTRLYSPVTNQDPEFTNNHKLKGIPAPLQLWSNYGIKTILTNLRDNKLSGCKWSVDKPDEEYDKQMYSEGIVDVIDKKSGQTVQRFMQRYEDNHYFDCECMCLVGAMRAKAFSITKVDEAMIKKIADNTEEAKQTKDQENMNKILNYRG